MSLSDRYGILPKLIGTSHARESGFEGWLLEEHQLAGVGATSLALSFLVNAGFRECRSEWYNDFYEGKRIHP